MSAATATRFETGHVGLNVTDVARSTRFYQEVFGFEVADGSDQAGRRFAFLKQGEVLVLTLWEQSEEGFARDRSGLHHLSFRVDSMDEVRQAEDRVRALEARVYHDGVVAHAEGAQSGGLFFEDPDGIRLEIYAPGGAAGEAAPTPGAPTCGFF